MAANISVITEDNCSGCAACFAICPQDAIAMKENKEGFWRPVVDIEKCNNCGLCYQICPFVKRIQKNAVFSNPDVWSCWHKDKDTLLNSTSGGAFSAFAEKIIEQKGVVYGAAWTDDLRVCHKRISSIEQLSDLRGSKYVQSEMRHVYPWIKEDLERKKHVLFSGTPCQVAGLYAYLQEDPDTLITVELICHGVNSPLVFEKYIAYLSEKYGSSVLSINFREKKRTQWESPRIEIQFKNGRILTERHSINPYFCGFMKNYYLRKSCFHCIYANLPRVSDVSIGDFWCWNKVNRPKNYNKMGTSLVLTNTHKGNTFFLASKSLFSCEKETMEKAIPGNFNIIKPTEKADDGKREEVFNYIYSNNQNALFSKYLNPGLIVYVKKVIDRLKNIFWWF